MVIQIEIHAMPWRGPGCFQATIEQEVEGQLVHVESREFTRRMKNRSRMIDWIAWELELLAGQFNREMAAKTM